MVKKSLSYSHNYHLDYLSMKKLNLVLTALLAFTSTLLAQPPKVAVVIVLDQFPYSYIQRFQPYFSKNGGINYLLQHGANFVNAEYEHAFTKTSPGHAAISTGTYSNTNGIIGNDWYDRAKKKRIGCVNDDSAKVIGNKSGGRSPKNLLTYTIGDMLRLQTNFHSKVIAVSNKDRAAILMAGKFGIAYWTEDSLFVTSTYYMQALPDYIREFNSVGFLKKYFGVEWKEGNAEAAAFLCDDDDVPYEANWAKINKKFPHIIVGENSSTITPSYYIALNHSPFATESLLEFARKVFKAESLGMHSVTDFLCIGVSATDEIGHAFGPNSHETFDNILKTDEMLGQFFSFLEKQIGLENCLIALSSDHGIAPIPEYLRKRSPNSTAGRVKSREIVKFAERVLQNKLGNPSGKNWIEQIVECDIYLNRDVMREYNISPDSAMRVLKDSLLSLPFIADVITRDEIANRHFSTTLGEKVEKTFHPQRSGDVIYLLKPYNIMSGDSVGSNHGQPYEYDSHVPLILFGRNFKQGIYYEQASPIDIAATLAAALGIDSPPTREGRILKEAMK